MFGDIKQLWSAWVRFPKSEGEIKFCYAPMEVKKRYDTTLEMKYPYFIDRNNSTYYFDESMLDKEYQITDELRVFYSESKANCMEWITKEREKLIDLYKRDLKRLENSAIEETAEKI